MCGPRRRGHHTAEDEQLLRTLGSQAALSLSHVRLSEQLRTRLDQLDAQASELAASRARLVAAEAAGRRRLERDIHDGVQQQLVSLMTKLTVARAQLGAGSDTVGATLDTMQQEFRQVVVDLRDLASGIHPAVLTDQGLVAAVVALAARLPLPVTIESPNGASARMDQQVEAAAYFGIAEALTNVLKHAGARRAWVRLAHADDRLTVEIGDDGRGFDTAATRQRGLSGLRDRVEALDGTLVLASRPAGPTTIRMTLPTPAAGDG
jgi:signal transduction histidine kinase